MYRPLDGASDSNHKTTTSETGMSATDERERAIKKAKTNFHEALSLARKVSEPWYRAQALAWVAR
jgi:hypothetical protein